MTKGHPWGIDARYIAVIHQHLRLKWNANKIAWATGIPERTVEHYITSFNRTGSLFSPTDHGIDFRGSNRQQLSRYVHQSDCLQRAPSIFINSN